MKKNQNQPVKLIIGMGNPGEKYAQTRHNVGFWIVDELASSLGVKINKQRYNSLYGKAVMGRDEQGPAISVILAKPLTYVNNSGLAVGALVNRYKVNIKDLLVIVDDFNLGLGTMRFRKKGGAGGHNGLKSIIGHLQTEEFSRIRVGIGPCEYEDASEFVLRKFKRSEIPEIEIAIHNCVHYILNLPIKGEIHD